MPWPFSSRKRSAPGGDLALAVGSVTAAARTDIGQRHGTNEDAVGLAGDESRGLLLLVVADGVGGLKHGDVASRATVDAAKGALAIDDTPAIESLMGALQATNQQLFNASFEAGGAASGSTVVAMLIEQGVATVVHAGDSRAYLFRGGALRLLTRDHSLVMDQVEQGLLTEEQAANSPRRNVITRCIGVEAEVDLATTAVGPLEPGDRIMLCSDGLNGVVSADELSEALASDDPLPEIAARLVELANSYGGPDNISVVLARVGEAEA